MFIHYSNGEFKIEHLIFSMILVSYNIENSTIHDLGASPRFLPFGSKNKFLYKNMDLSVCTAYNFKTDFNLILKL